MVMLYTPPVYSINFLLLPPGSRRMACRKFPFLIFSRIRTVTSGSGRATARTATMATNSLSIKTKSTIMQH